MRAWLLAIPLTVGGCRGPTPAIPALDEVRSDLFPEREPDIAGAEHWLVEGKAGKLVRAALLVAVDNISLKMPEDEPIVGPNSFRYAIGWYGAPGPPGSDYSTTEYELMLSPLGVVATRNSERLDAGWQKANPSPIPQDGLPILC